MDGRIQFGTCGWSDNSIKTCGRFYPSWVQTSEERLSIYSKTFPCVEVDSSTYAIPSPYNTKKWALSTPQGFKFHFKAFGLFTHQSAPLNTLPKKVRELVSSDVLPHDAVVTLQQLGDAGEKLAWDLFHAALAPVIACNKMGCVVFQFQLSFLDTVKNRSYVEHCRKMLSAFIPMAVEFRNRAWFSRSASNNEDLCSWLNTLGVCLISADELEHETFQRDRHQTGLPAGAVRCIMPISMSVTQPSYHYIRLHRRHGTKERILPAEEIQAWSLRLSEKLIPEVAGPVYFMWATDWEDAPIVNMRALYTALGPALCYDWKSQLSKIGAASKGSISSHFSAKRERESTEAHESEDLLGQQGCGMELKPDGHSSCVQRRDLVASGAAQQVKTSRANSDERSTMGSSAVGNKQSSGKVVKKRDSTDMQKSISNGQRLLTSFFSK
ncbi:hypothetical protein CEUSTIGMA_g7243.t1 [Chlamydomonas eustigma]|uniref:DUF72 domain-containing protein n=1 Tax=Chlamydomonas eustigma TaxID=1157962 RepID=A0A250X9L8_9CHLO|nr:hypothetical protein CEUSTIGMA_g7243.t1 [Chlamydomonas eustigma]|eukprot:GAX79803.1 hypothetical protein CEUSTIGMA_g7243.t1 [Chlamydomonas eustigma]